ncbi:hypothetical protein C5167_000144 [Papaver somniferum]|uniref:Major facilitator superfamily (MFS) profile domain-containing protein n=1 Tax=Papaver somniferum TaxID=3469 RepID=A0A4Y7KTS8_PAPSO|nr:protein NRT1/ PTR FAMILY 5.10-like [Papaver somniferum]RZC75812.1 hypothetical protein C5167_000144 [Papaver somniferum]
MTGADVGNEALLQYNDIITNLNEEGDQSRKYIKGMVNYKGEKLLNMINNQQFGGWKSACRLLVIDVADAFAFFGISTNLISYLTNHFGQSTATAALNVNVWVGVVFMLPLIISFFADSYIGRFRFVLASSFFEILGLGCLSICALNGSINSSSCVSNKMEGDKSCPYPSSVQESFFFLSLYLVAIGSAGNQSCAPAFGADQFDGQNLSECESKSSFFTWVQIGSSAGSVLSNTILNYIQDNLGWGLGFGISCISSTVALIVFLFGIKTYRYSVIDEENENPLLGIIEVLVASVKNWSIHSPSSTSQEEASEGFFTMPNDAESSSNHVTNNKVEEKKSLFRLMPVWIICLIYPVVLSQTMTLFTMQSSKMDRTLGPEFQIPAASMNIFGGLSVILFSCMYDRIFVPLARSVTGKPNGITTLQRIGTGIFISAVSMACAAVVERKRLQTAIDFELVDMPNETVPMSVWWLIPQYLLIGLATTFTSVGLQELFYDQVPNGLKSVGLSLNLSLFGIGFFISGFLISVIQKVTSGHGQYGWFSNNLNCAHLDYFYWLLAGLSTLEMIAFLCYSIT